MKIVLVLLVVATFATAQRITTIQLDGVQYFVSRMNPYSPELNYFLAYQYCRSLGLQLASFETKEKADTMTQYLKNAGYIKYDFWTSGNKLGTDMFLWMSTGLPFNATFDYMLKRPGNRPVDVPPGTEPQRVARESGDSGSADGCVAMMAPTLAWEAQDCTLVKDFICEQTRCYYYNYGSIPVSATQGNRRPYITTTSAPASDDQIDHHEEKREDDDYEDSDVHDDKTSSSSSSSSLASSSSSASASASSSSGSSSSFSSSSSGKSETIGEGLLPEDPVVSRLITTAVPASGNQKDAIVGSTMSTSLVREEVDRESSIDEDSASSSENMEDRRADDIPDIASLFTDGSAASEAARKVSSVFDGLETREILRAAPRSPVSLSSIVDMKAEHRESPDYNEQIAETELPNNGLEDAHTIGPYDSVQDYANDQPEDIADTPMMKDQDDDSSTILPEAEPAYRYNIKVRTNGKVLDPPSK